MRVIETLQQVGDRLQVAMVVCEVPKDGSGHLTILYANAVAASLFGFPGGKALRGMDVRTIMPDSHARDHKARVADYVSRANGGSKIVSGIMDQWRNLDAKRRDGTLVPVQANVGDIRNTEERYFVALFRDRSNEVKREQALVAAVNDAQQAADEAEAAREVADRLREEAEAARAEAEGAALKHKRLSGQISLLRQIFAGTIGLVVMLGVLVVAQWATGISDPDGLAMVERVLLVLTGILGSAMASVFDSRNRTD
jgi:PAS domain S-box-containing protein